MFNFIFPSYLWLLLVLLPLWAFSLSVPRTIPPWRAWASLSLRTAGIAALVLAMAGMQVIRPIEQLNVIFLLDTSDSIALSQRARAETYLQQALDAMPPDDRTGIVVFGKHALIERLPDTVQTLGRLNVLPDGEQTDIARALYLGLALMPAETQRRIVLMSDGAENSGSAREAARLVAAQGIPIDIVPLDGTADGFDAQITGLELPSVAAESQQLRMVVHVASHSPDAAFPVDAQLVIEQRFFPLSTTTPDNSPRDTPVLNQHIELTGEPQSFEVAIPPPDHVFNRYIVRLLAEEDARPENNVAEAFTLVRGSPRVLLVEGTPDAARNLQQALQARLLNVETIAPSAMPTTLTGLIAYDAVVLVDVPRDAIPEQAVPLLATFVRNLGRGLAMVGGPQSFGAGGWRDTPLEDALPVYMDVRTKTLRQPPVSIVVVIDVSGSMAMQEKSGATKVQLAAEGAARIAAQLRDEDEITVIPFSSQAEGVVGPLPGTERQRAIERIARVSAGGGGINMHDALREAAKVIRNSDKPVRHIITITDGNDTVQKEGAQELIATLHADGVTISSVAVGDGQDVPFIETLVETGEGRFFLTRRASDIPDILTHEAEIVIQPLVIEEEFTPVVTALHPILRDVDAMPALSGYVATTAKDTAQVLMQTRRNEPLLAVWHYGLGRSLAWTSDMRGQWATRWVRQPDYPPLAARMITWLLPSPEQQRLSLDTRTVGNQLVMIATAHTETETPATGLHVMGQMIAADGSLREVMFHEVQPGSYRLAVQDAAPGAYMVHIIANNEHGEPQMSVTGGAVVPFSAEYGSVGGNPALLETLATATGGRTLPRPDAIYDDTMVRRGQVVEMHTALLWLALLLLPLDIAVRRLFTFTSRTFGQRSSLARPGMAASSARSGSSTPGGAHHRPPVPPPPDDPGDPLERLQAAQERARKRARGEE
jgi:Mg-chelatase subunit ChlD